MRRGNGPEGVFLARYAGCSYFRAMLSIHRRLFVALPLLALPSSLALAAGVDDKMQVQSGLRVQLQQSREKTTTGKSFSEVAKTGLAKGATLAGGADMVVGVVGLEGKKAATTRVLALDAGLLMKKSGGKLPATAAKLKAALKKYPAVILMDVFVEPPGMVRLSGVPKGTKVTVVTGAEGILGNPPMKPPGSQAVVVNQSELVPPLRKHVPKARFKARIKAPAKPRAPAKTKKAPKRR